MPNLKKRPCFYANLVYWFMCLYSVATYFYYEGSRRRVNTSEACSSLKVNQPLLINTLSCLLQTLHSSSSAPASHLAFSAQLSPRSPARNRHLSPGEILMGLQGPCRSNYVEQLLSLTGPRLPGGERESTRRAKLAYFWQNTQHAWVQITPSFITAAGGINAAARRRHPKFNLEKYSTLAFW